VTATLASGGRDKPRPYEKTGNRSSVRQWSVVSEKAEADPSSRGSSGWHDQSRGAGI